MKKSLKLRTLPLQKDTDNDIYLCHGLQIVLDIVLQSLHMLDLHKYPSIKKEIGKHCSNKSSPNDLLIFLRSGRVHDVST